jgi:hypothetical protein
MTHSCSSLLFYELLLLLLRKKKSQIPPLPTFKAANIQFGLMTRYSCIPDSLFREPITTIVHLHCSRANPWLNSWKHFEIIASGKGWQVVFLSVNMVARCNSYQRSFTIT